MHNIATPTLCVIHCLMHGLQMDTFEKCASRYPTHCIAQISVQLLSHGVKAGKGMGMQHCGCGRHEGGKAFALQKNRGFACGGLHIISGSILQTHNTYCLFMQGV